MQVFLSVLVYLLEVVFPSEASVWFNPDEINLFPSLCGGFSQTEAAAAAAWFLLL